MTLPYDTNRYRCTIIRHVDADTSWVTVDLGFDCSLKMAIRWADIDAVERSDPLGPEATAYVNTVLPPGQPCFLTTIRDKREKYGRYLGTFWQWSDAPMSVNQMVIDAGYAVPYGVTA